MCIPLKIHPRVINENTPKGNQQWLLIMTDVWLLTISLKCDIWQKTTWTFIVYYSWIIVWVIVNQLIVFKSQIVFCPNSRQQRLHWCNRCSCFLGRRWCRVGSCPLQHFTLLFNIVCLFVYLPVFLLVCLFACFSGLFICFFCLHVCLFVYLCVYLRGTMRTFLFLSLLSARCPAAQSPIVNRGVWLQINWKRKTSQNLDLGRGHNFFWETVEGVNAKKGGSRGKNGGSPACVSISHEKCFQN